jgi:hypothetical protein
MLNEFAAAGIPIANVLLRFPEGRASYEFKDLKAAGK